MRVTGIILIILSIVTWIGSFGNFDNRAQAGGSIIAAALFGIVGILLIVLSSRRSKPKDS